MLRGLPRGGDGRFWNWPVHYVCLLPCFRSVLAYQVHGILSQGIGLSLALVVDSLKLFICGVECFVSFCFVTLARAYIVLFFAVSVVFGCIFQQRRPRRWIPLIRDISLLTIALRFWQFKTEENVWECFENCCKCYLWKMISIKMTYLMFTLRYLDVSGFLEVV